jgi:hypothetical protein
MADEDVNVITDAAPVADEDQGVNISIEQICAAIINTYKTAIVPIENILKDYSNKNIAVMQDPETQALAFSLTDNPVPEDEAEAE